MKVSIVTISYNQASFLEQALLSVLEQDYPEIEYIVVDPGSMDGSREIIEKYRSRISKVIFEPDLGPADGLNKGFVGATGDVLGFLNADDYLLPGSISIIVDYFKKYPDKEVVSGHGYIVDDLCRQLRLAHSNRIGRFVYAYGAGILFQQSTYFRSKVFNRIGGFNLHNHTCWDGELWADMILCDVRFGRIHKYLSAFRLHSTSISGSKKLEKLYLEDLQRIRRKLGMATDSILFGRLLWFFNRLSDPMLLWLWFKNILSLNRYKAVVHSNPVQPGA